MSDSSELTTLLTGKWEQTYVMFNNHNFHKKLYFRGASVSISYRLFINCLWPVITHWWPTVCTMTRCWSFDDFFLKDLNSHFFYLYKDISTEISFKFAISSQKVKKDIIQKKQGFKILSTIIFNVGSNSRIGLLILWIRNPEIRINTVA